jgi:hypothetical protein
VVASGPAGHLHGRLRSPSLAALAVAPNAVNHRCLCFAVSREVQRKSWLLFDVAGAGLR